MWLHNLIPYPLYAGENVGSGSSMSRDDMQSFLKDDTVDLTDNKTVKPAGDKVDDKVDEEVIDIVDPDADDEDDDDIDLDKKDDDDKDDDDEEIDPDDEKLELLSHVSRKEILKQFPDLFKKFPYLERAYYRNLQFTELFSKPEDAKVALESATTLRNIESQLLAGDTKVLLKAVKDEDPDAFHKMVDGYLDTLNEVDPKMWEHVVGNLNKQTIFAMFREGKTSGNEELMKAALTLNQFIFGTSQYTPPVVLSKADDKSPKEKEIEEKERKFNETRLSTHRNEVEGKANNSIRNTIELNIDPNNKIENQYLKNKIIEDAEKSLDNLMKSDKKYVKLLDDLWNSAKRSEYDTKSLDKVKSAIINKARTLLTGVIKDARNKALKNGGTRVEEKGDRKGPAQRGKPATQNSGGRINKADPKSIPADMSSTDYMMQDD